jgi:hypothetical protein
MTSWPWHGSESKEIITKPLLDRCAVFRKTKVKKSRKLSPTSDSRVSKALLARLLVLLGVTDPPMKRD